MDFQTLKRRELQALCKLNNIPANLTNAAMADSLQSLPTVNGVEDLLELLQTGVADSPYVGTSIRRKPAKEGMECSELATRTRCGTRGVAIEGIETRKTTATATRTTTRRRANKEASIQREIEKNMQAKFEEDLELSDITANSGIESEETSVEDLTASVDCILSRSQNELEHKGEEVNNNGEVAYVGDDKENMGEDQAVNEAQEDYIEMSNIMQKFDFHSLGRKDLQNFCKRNKIPANLTNAAMADALVSLDNVEGLEEFLEAYDPLAIKSPETSQRTSSRVSQARTARKTTGKKAARPGSAICKSMSRKMESLVLDSIDCVPENSSTTIDEESKPLSEEVLNGADTSTDALVTVKEIQEETGENKCDGRGTEGALTEMCDTSEEVDANLITESNTGIQSAVVSVKEFSNHFEIGVELQDDASENASNDQEVKVDISESNMDELVITEAPEEDINELDQCIETNDNNADTQTLESEFHTDSSDEPNCEGLMHDASAVVIKEFVQSAELSDLEADDKEPEDDDVEQQFAFEAAAQAKATPLCHKSLRKLKKLVKEKIQETNLLAKKLEKLTLQENEIPADNNSEVDVAKLKKDDLTKVTELSDQLDSTTGSVFEDDEESNEDLEMKAKDANKDAGAPISLPLELLKVPKPLVLTTPIKSSSKTPISAIRTLRVLDANKENIDDSTTKTTEVGNIKMTVTPAKSIGKLKKEVKVLLQSEKKRPALQSRSDNQCSLTSP